MYNIKEAAARSGVSIATLRAWERRYGVVAPQRTASGYRLYDDDAIGRLRQMRRLLEGGWRPREAALEVLAGRAGDVELLAGLDAPGSSTEKSVVGRLIDDFVSAVAPFDSGSLGAVMDETFARGTFEWAIEAVVFPALREVGRRWEMGQVDVAAEHAASHHVVRRLSMLFDAAARPGPGYDVVVGLPPGARHDLGALAFGVAARRMSIGVLYVGADVPARSWLEALDQTGIRLAVMAVPTNADAEAAASVIDLVRAELPAVTWMVGGAGLGALPGDTHAIRLSNGIGEAARGVRQQLDHNGR